jgi:general secretion pathway protein J
MISFRTATRQDERGFSLIEVLIALTLFALLMALLSNGVHIGTRIEAHGSEQINEWAQVTAVQRFLRGELATAQVNRSANLTDETVIFRGEPNRLAFVGLLPDHFPVGGLQTITLSPAEDRRSDDLVVSWRLYTGDSVRPELPIRSDTLAPNEAVLLENISRIEFGYFGQRDSLRPPEWGDRWEIPNRVPSLVRMRLTLRGAVTAPPDLFIAIPAATYQR